MKAKLEELAKEKKVVLASVRVHGQKLYYLRKNGHLLNDGYCMNADEALELINNLKTAKNFAVQNGVL